MGDHPHAAHGRGEGLERFQAFRHELRRETRDAGQVPVRLREGLHDAGRHRIADEREHDGNGLRGRFGRERGRLAAGEDHVHARLDERLGGGAQFLRAAIGEPDVEDDVAAVLETGLAESDLEPVDGRVVGRRRVV